MFPTFSCGLLPFTSPHCSEVWGLKPPPRAGLPPCQRWKVSLTCEDNCAYPGNGLFPSWTPPVSEGRPLPACSPNPSAPFAVPGSRCTRVFCLPVSWGLTPPPSSCGWLLLPSSLFSCADCRFKPNPEGFICPAIPFIPAPAWPFWVEPCTPLGARHPNLPSPSRFSRLPPGDTHVLSSPAGPVIR